MSAIKVLDSTAAFYEKLILRNNVHTPQAMILYVVEEAVVPEGLQ